MTKIYPSFMLNLGIITLDFSEFPTILWYFHGCLDCIDWKAILVLSTQLLCKYAKIDMESSQIDIKKIHNSYTFKTSDIDIDIRNWTGNPDYVKLNPLLWEFFSKFNYPNLPYKLKDNNYVYFIDFLSKHFPYCSRFDVHFSWIHHLICTID